MQALVNASLVEWNQATGRFRLHDLVRHFCEGKLTGPDCTGARLRYARHYSAVAAEAETLYLQGGSAALGGLELFDCERVHLEEAFTFLDKLLVVPVEMERESESREINQAATALISLCE
jgi:hypothetical protein